MPSLTRTCLTLSTAAGPAGVTACATSTTASVDACADRVPRMMDEAASRAYLAERR